MGKGVGGRGGWGRASVCFYLSPNVRRGLGRDSGDKRKGENGDDECIDQEKGKVQKVEYGFI